MATPRKHFGYDGPETEAALIAAANRIVNDDRLGVVERIKAVDWPLGHIIKIAQAKGYTKILSFKGWCATHLHCSDTHAYQCAKAWADHEDFDAALDWQRCLNNGWTPKTNTGPGFQNELIKAWRSFKKGEDPFIAKPAAKGKDGQSAKVLNELRKEAEVRAGNYKTWYERLKAEHIKIAAAAQISPRVLHQIEHEIKNLEAPPEPDPPEPPAPSTKPASGLSGKTEMNKSDPAPDFFQQSLERDFPRPTKPKRQPKGVKLPIETTSRKSGSSLVVNQSESLSDMIGKLNKRKS
jgi:hypothetical protein